MRVRPLRSISRTRRNSAIASVRSPPDSTRVCPSAKWASANCGVCAIASRSSATAPRKSWAARFCEADCVSTIARPSFRWSAVSERPRSLSLRASSLRPARWYAWARLKCALISLGFTRIACSSDAMAAANSFRRSWTRPRLFAASASRGASSSATRKCCSDSCICPDASKRCPARAPRLRDPASV